MRSRLPLPCDFCGHPAAYTARLLSGEPVPVCAAPACAAELTRLQREELREQRAAAS